MSILKEIYWAAPYFLKCWMASWNARLLDRWRHGAAYERLCREIAEHDGWSPEQFAEYQEARLREIVALAGAHVPYYREAFADAGVDVGSFRGSEDLARLPILEKQPVRADSTRFVDERRDLSKLKVSHTSGTTGTPLDLYRDVAVESAAFAFFDARCREVAGMRRRRNASVSLCGHLVAAPQRAVPPFWVHNRRWKQLYMSSYHLAPKYLPAYVEQMRAFGGESIEGYPSSVYSVAKFIVDNGLEPVPFKACFTTAETLFDFQREAIRQAFQCRTYDQYGCGEAAIFAAECELGSMHLSPEVSYVEIVDENDRPVEPGVVGHVVCTSLLNDVQPFVRYRLGDLAALSPTPCACGRPLPVLDRIEGRIDAVLITRDGRRIGRLDPVFKGAEGIAEAQIVQNDYDQFVVRIVPGKGYTDADGETIARNLAERTGEADIRVERVAEIERTASGKFPAVVCKLPRDLH